MSNIQTNTNEQTSTKKVKRVLTPVQKKAKIAASWIINILCIVIIIFSLVVAITTVVRTTNKDGIANIGGTAFMPVASDSMTGTFEKGDMILTKVYNGNGSDLKVGQVVSYKSNKNGFEFINTHRIVEVIGAGTTSVYFRTKGDKAGLETDGSILYTKNIVATWGSADENGVGVDGKNWVGMGKMSNWLQDVEKGKMRFFTAIVLPLILLFVLYAFILIRTLVIAKLEKVKATAGSTPQELSDEDKKRLAEEYIASLKSGATEAVKDSQEATSNDTALTDNKK